MNLLDIASPCPMPVIKPQQEIYHLLIKHIMIRGFHVCDCLVLLIDILSYISGIVHFPNNEIFQLDEYVVFLITAPRSHDCIPSLLRSLGAPDHCSVLISE